MKKIRFPLLGLLLLSCQLALAEIQLPKLLSEGAILQRDKPVTLWGKSDNNEEVKIFFNDELVATTLASDGSWEYKMKAQPAGGPHCLTFEASNKIKICNILFGDLYLASGQSNMEISVARIKYYFPKEFSKINFPKIRQFTVPKSQSFKGPKTEINGGTWIPAQSLYIDEFSAVAFFFAKDIHLSEDVPVGIIKNAMGGSTAQGWISRERLADFPSDLKQAQRLSDDNYLNRIKEDDALRFEEWLQELNKGDEGLDKKRTLLGKTSPLWFAPKLNDESWDTLSVPGLWEEGPLSSFNGIIWLRKTIQLTKENTGRVGILRLGNIVDADQVYVNGSKVGETTYKYPPRRYLIDPDILKEGDNTIAVRLQVNAGNGGFVPEKPYWLQIGKKRLTLGGEWKFKIGAVSKPIPEKTFVEYLAPTGYYNDMLAPLANLQLSGVLWYQGESNVTSPIGYDRLMATLIKNWRDLFKQPKLPFLNVQLANFLKASTTPQESQWAELRQAQLNTLAIPNTALIVTIDVGEWNDIHPIDKRTVGSRLALAAQYLIYNKKEVVYSGPTFRCYEKNQDAITLYFDHVGEGLATDQEGTVDHIAIKTGNNPYEWRVGEITEDNTVRINGGGFQGAISIRYGWADNPDTANLYNAEGLPASPFESSTRCR